MAKESSFEEFINDHVEGNVKDMCNINCSNCNDCCTMGAMLTKEEFELIKKHMKKDKRIKQIAYQGAEKIRKYLENGTIYWICPFSTSKKRCGIYNIRPRACREFHCDAKIYEQYQTKYDDIAKNSPYTIADLFYADWREHFAKRMIEKR